MASQQINSAERAKVRREVFDFHRRGLACPYGSCCAQERLEMLGDQ